MLLKEGQIKDSNRGRYIPAFDYGFLTPLYDHMMRWAARESTFKPHLVKQGRISKGQRVLDLGCGTATLTILIKEAHPEAEVIGLDGDPEILEIARSKIWKAGLDISLDHAMAFELPYPSNSFDRVMASMVLHHLKREDKVRTLKEAFRVLTPGGELHVAELGRPHNPLMLAMSIVMRHFEEASDGIRGLLPNMLGDAGFEAVEETARYMTMVGTTSLYRAKKLAF